MGEKVSEEKSVLSTTLIELQIEQLSKKVEGLEKIINEFMSKWGPDAVSYTHLTLPTIYSV